MRTADEIDILEMKVRGLERELRDMRETLRDKFAMAALAAVPASIRVGNTADAAIWAYQMADSMLAVRNNNPTTRKANP